MGDALLLFNISRPQRLTELSNVTQMASRTLAGNSRWSASPLHSRGLTISSSEPNSFAVRIGGRFTPGSWQSKPLPRALLGTPRAVEDHAMQSAAFQGGASCIKDSAAFSFDEPQVL